MARFTIDAATLLHVVENDLACDPAHQVVAPNLIRSHALSLLFTAVASGRLTEPEALELHERLTAFRMRLLGDRVSRRTAWKIATEHRWESIFDAEYVAVCKLQADAFVSVDPVLLARAGAIVPTAGITDLLRP